MKNKVLVVDDEKNLTSLFKRILSEKGNEVSTANNIREALKGLDDGPLDLVFCDIVLGGESGIDLLREIKERGLKCPVIMITGAPSVESASEAVRLGAFDYITKPLNMEEILKVTAVALRHKELLERYESTRKNLEAIFSTVKDAILMVDSEMRVVEANNSALGFCSLTRDKIGSPLMEVSECLYSLCSEAVEKTLETCEAVERKGLESDHGGVTKVLDLSTYPLLDEKGGPMGAVIVVRDQTRLVSLERDLNERINFHNIIGKSPAMQRLYSFIESLSDIDSTVLMTGESGTGKEMVVDALHLTGKRRDSRLIKVNCAAISEQLLESELFGHVKGAFTGAISDKKGRFELADGGTLFLDEVGDLSQATQVKLLRVLQSMEFERVGDTRPIKVDVRVVTATNRDLREMVRNGEFREDLFYRLNVIELSLPPLRERKGDIPLLVDYFIDKLSVKMGRPKISLSMDAMQRLMDHSWPGNVRELEHTLEYCLAMSGGGVIAVSNLPADLRAQPQAVSELKNEPASDEKTDIIDALEAEGWKKAKAARRLNISRQTLYEKLKKYGIQPPENKV